MEGAASVVAFPDFVESSEGHASHHLLFRHGEHLDDLHEVVAELVVKFAFYFFQFLFRFVWESRAQILPDHLGAIESPCEQATEIGKGVKHGKRQQTDEPQESLHKSVFHLV